MLNRRQFMAAATQPVGAAAALAFLHPRRAVAIAEVASRHPGTADEIAADEPFWAEVRRAFVVDRTVINLNNGGVSPVAGGGAGGPEALPGVLERRARPHDVAGARAPARDGAGEAGPLFRRATRRRSL